MSATSRKTIKVINKPKEWDSTFQLMSWWKADQVKNAKVLVVGSGALGNEVLKNLALLGVGNIVLVDFDIIEYSNLSRSILFRESDAEKKLLKVNVAAERTNEINPDINIIPINGDITIDVGLGVFRRMDAIIGCLDNRLARLALNRFSFWVGKSWVDGAIENLAGQLNVYTPEVNCYESNLSEFDWANIKHKLGCADIARRNSSQGRIPTTPISASIIGAMQAQEALKMIHRNDNKIIKGKTFYYEGMNNETFMFDTGQPSDEAMSSYLYDPIIEASDLSANATIKETLDWAKQHFETDNPIILLDNRLVLEIIPSKKNQRIPIMVAYPHLSDAIMSPYLTEPDEEIIIGKDTARIDSTFRKQDITLKEIGIPYLHIIRIFANDEIHFVELTGDENFLTFK